MTLSRACWIRTNENTAVKELGLTTWRMPCMCKDLFRDIVGAFRWASIKSVTQFRDSLHDVGGDQPPIRTGRNRTCILRICRVAFPIKLPFLFCFLKGLQCPIKNRT